MGKLVRVVSRKEEYGNYQAFNWKQEDFKSLLYALGCTVHEDEMGYSDRWECPKKEYEQAIENLKAYSDGERVFDVSGDECDRDDIEDAISELGGTDNIPYIILSMEHFLEEADNRENRNEYIIFVAY